jgi:hypothetical protein
MEAIQTEPTKDIPPNDFRLPSSVLTLYCRIDVRDACALSKLIRLDRFVRPSDLVLYLGILVVTFMLLLRYTSPQDDSPGQACRDSNNPP